MLGTTKTYNIMTQLIKDITTKVQIKGNHSQIHFQNLNLETNKVTIEEVVAIAKPRTIKSTIDKTTISALNSFGIDPIAKTVDVLHNELNTELDSDLINLIDKLDKQPQIHWFKKFMYWLTKSSPLFYITSPTQLYDNILHNCYFQQLFIILPPHLAHVLKNHPNFKQSNHDYTGIQLIGHINSNPIFVNNHINTSYIQTGSIPNNIYFATTPPQIEQYKEHELIHIKLQTKTILHYIPQPLNRFNHFYATTKPKPLYKKIFKL